MGICDNIFLNNRTGQILYKDYAKNLPIVDYHCHLVPREIYEDNVFDNIGQIWLAADHYKWRLMRFCGVDEKYVTGDASFEEKFYQFAKILPQCMGNPVYQWAHFELKQYFGVDEFLCEENAKEIFEKANKVIAERQLSPRKLIEMSNVSIIATTDDPCDTLEWHVKIKEKEISAKVVPTYRPDRICDISKSDFVSYIRGLEKRTGTKINNITDLLSAACKTIEHFKNNGCKIADHGFSTVPKVTCTAMQANEIFCRAMEYNTLSKEECEKFLWFMLRFFACEYKKKDWTIQLHMSVIRNQNSSIFNNIGADSGTDSVGDLSSVVALGGLFDNIEKECGMPKAILYTLNPSMYYPLATMAGNFSNVQLGAAWWFCDHRNGIIEQLKIFADTQAIGKFNGMLTDSRSFVSYARHDYFRRILCNLLGEWVEAGEIPNDATYIKGIIEAICYKNAMRIFED